MLTTLLSFEILCPRELQILQIFRNISLMHFLYELNDQDTDLDPVPPSDSELRSLHSYLDPICIFLILVLL
jgi:hypothetical protein